MGNFVDFAGYSFFSGLEYFSLIFIVLCMFRFKLKYFIKEMIITTLILTFISYILLMANMTPFIMLVNFVLLTLIFMFIFKEKCLYSLWITFSGTTVFAIAQTSIVMISMLSGTITPEDTTQSFGFTVFAHQALTATIIVAIGSWIKYTNSGFGFNFRTQLNKPLYTMIALLSVVVCSVFFFLYSSQEHHVFFCLMISSFISLFILAIRFSFLKEQEEFSY